MSAMNNSQNLMQYSMQAGVWLGVYLIARFVCSVLSIYSPLLNLLAMVLLVGTPVILYYLMVRYHRLNKRVSGTSLMWMLGTMLFLFASLICAVPEYIFYRYIHPEYLSETISQSVALIKEMKLIDDETVLKELDSMATSGAAPTAIQMVMSSIWSNTFFGSLLALPVGFFIVRRNK